MKNKVYESFGAAVKDVPDGAVILLVCFIGAGGIPQNLLMALRNQGAKDLTLVSANTGLARGIMQRAGLKPWVTPNILVENHQVKKIIASVSSGSLAHKQPGETCSCEEAILSGEVEWEPVGLGVLSERLRAGAAGTGGFYSPIGIGTVLERGKEKRVIDGKEYLLEKPIKADYAFIRGYKSDPLGNLVYRGTRRNLNPLMAMAARVSIAEVDDIVAPGGLDPESIVTSGIWIDRIVKLREGDWRY